MAKQYPSRETVSVVSSGDTSKDNVRIDRFVETDRLIAEGMCPNEHGAMVAESPNVRTCRVCGFFHGSSKVGVSYERLSAK